MQGHLPSPLTVRYLLMENEHLLNILKIISNDDYDETIADRIYQYLESRKVLDIGYGKVSDCYLNKLDALLANTYLTKRAPGSASPYEYVVVQQDPPSR